MPTRFERNGEFAAGITRHFLALAIEAEEARTGALNADYSWEAFVLKNPQLAANIAQAHPPPASHSDDPNFKARDNVANQKKRFVKWLQTASGE